MVAFDSLLYAKGEDLLVLVNCERSLFDGCVVPRFYIGFTFISAYLLSIPQPFLHLQLRLKPSPLTLLPPTPVTEMLQVSLGRLLR